MPAPQYNFGDPTGLPNAIIDTTAKIVKKPFEEVFHDVKKAEKKGKDLFSTKPGRSKQTFDEGNTDHEKYDQPPPVDMTPGSTGENEPKAPTPGQRSPRRKGGGPSIPKGTTSQKTRDIVDKTSTPAKKPRQKPVPRAGAPKNSTNPLASKAL